MFNVFIVSDGTGWTAEQMLRAALTQFPKIRVKYEKRQAIFTKEAVKKVIKEASEVNGIIIHTFVSDNIRDYLICESRIMNLETIDLMGPLLSRLSHYFSVTPMEKPGLFRHLNNLYFRRVETTNFAFKHDDGMRTQDLHKAEIVLVGVSRTFKTPLSIYLAFEGWLVANVPIVLGMEPPPSLFEINPENVFCLTTSARRLAELRKVRHERLGEQTGNYSTFEYVQQELNFAHRIFNRKPEWTIINVTGKAIEEIASEIISLKRHSIEETNE